MMGTAHMVKQVDQLDNQPYDLWVGSFIWCPPCSWSA